MLESSIAGVKIDANNILLAWGNSTQTDVYAVVINESAGTLTKGDIATVDSARDTQYISLCMPDSTNALIGYTDASGGVNLRVGVINVSGTSLIPLSTYEVATPNVDYPAIVPVNTTSNYAMLFFMDDDASDNGKYIVLAP